MNGSRTIRVFKRDGAYERFDVAKFAGSMYAAMRGTSGRYRDAVDLAEAIVIYLVRTDRRRVGSAILLAMAVKVLRRVRLCQAAKAMEEDHELRRRRRAGVRVRHSCEDGHESVTMWDKGWLAEWGRHSWGLMSSTARVMAGEVERQLLEEGVEEIARSEVLDRLNECVSEFGLVDAVPAWRSGAVMSARDG